VLLLPVFLFKAEVPCPHNLTNSWLTYHLWQRNKLIRKNWPTFTQGRRHNFKSGGYKYYCERSEQKIFWGLYPPHMPFWGYNSYKKRHTESLSDSVATISCRSCSCINKPINKQFYLAAFRFSSCTGFKMPDCMSNVQYHCSSKLHRKQNFQVLKANVNCVTFAARPAVVPRRCTT